MYKYKTISGRVVYIRPMLVSEIHEVSVDELAIQIRSQLPANCKSVMNVIMAYGTNWLLQVSEAADLIKRVSQATTPAGEDWRD